MCHTPCVLSSRATHDSDFSAIGDFVELAMRRLAKATHDFALGKAATDRVVFSRAHRAVSFWSDLAQHRRACCHLACTLLPCSSPVRMYCTTFSQRSTSWTGPCGRSCM